MGGAPNAAAAVIDVGSHGIRALVASAKPSGEVPTTHAATAALAPPGFTVAPISALALLTSEAPSDRVALALRRSDDVALHQMATQLDHALLARAQIAFGLGMRTGLWRGEKKGSNPRQPEAGATSSPESTADQAVGRGALRVTPLQLARAYATLATGKLNRLSLGADGQPSLEPVFEDEWSRVEPDFVRALSVYTPHLDLVRDALRGTLSDAPTDPIADVVGTCGTATAVRNGAEVTFGWCAGYGGEPPLAFAVMVEGSTGALVRDRVRAWWTEDAR